MVLEFWGLQPSRGLTPKDKDLGDKLRSKTRLVVQKLFKFIIIIFFLVVSPKIEGYFQMQRLRS